MRVFCLIVSFVLGVLASSAIAQAPAEGQQAAASQSRAQMPIAVVDIGYLLNNHPTMKSEIEAIEQQMKAADEAMTKKRDEIIKQLEQLREKYTEGTPEYEREEKAIASQDTEFRLEIVKKRKDFDERRAAVLVRAYGEITGLLKYGCEALGTQVVLRFSRETMDAQKPETVQRVMGQDVIYYHPNIDLTNWVMDGLSRQARTPTANAGAAPTR